MSLSAEASKFKKPFQPQSLEEHLATAAQNHQKSRSAAATNDWFSCAGLGSNISSTLTSEVFATSIHPAPSYLISSIGPELQETAEILCFMASGITEQECTPPVSTADLSMESASTDIAFDDPLYMLSAACAAFHPSSLEIYDSSMGMPSLPLLDMDFPVPPAPFPYSSDGLPEDWRFPSPQAAQTFDATGSPSTPTLSSPNTLDILFDDFNLSDIDLDINMDFNPPLLAHSAAGYHLPLIGQTEYADKSCSNRECKDASLNEMMALLAAAAGHIGGEDADCEGFYGRDAAEQMLVNGHQGWESDSRVWMQGDA